MNPFVKYTLAVAMGASATQALAEIKEPAPVDQVAETPVELTTAQQAKLNNLQKALEKAVTDGKTADEISAMIADAVAKDPLLAASIRSLATEIDGITEQIVDAAVIQGLADAPSTAAGPTNPNAASPAIPGQRRATPSPRSSGGGGGSASGG